MVNCSFMHHIREYYKKNSITLEEYKFDLNDIDSSFKNAAMSIIERKFGPDLAWMRNDGYIKRDRYGKLYVELMSRSNIRIAISDEYINIPGKAIHVMEDDFLKEAGYMDYVYYEYIKNNLNASMFLKPFNEIESHRKRINDCFIEMLKKIRDEQVKLDKQKELSREQELVNGIEEITYNAQESETRMHSKSTLTSPTTTSHDEVPIYKRHATLLSLEPIMKLKAKSIDVNVTSYMSLLYPIGKNDKNEDLFVLVMEPDSSYARTEAVYFCTDKAITEEQFVAKTKEYLETPFDDKTGLVNVVRFNHKDEETFDKVVDAIFFNEGTPNQKKKVKIATENPEYFHQGSVK